MAGLETCRAGSYGCGMLLRHPAPVLVLAICSHAIAADVSGGGGKTGELKLAPRASEPFLSPADGKAETWRTNIRVPSGFKIETWASEPMLGNPVAFTFDEKGRCFTSETYRYRTSVLDIRHYYWMIEDDLAARSVEDRIALTKKNFPKDWQQLEKETEVVRLIEDTDGDGRADRSRVYADGFNTMLDGIASGVLARDGKVWFTNIPDLWLLEGTDPDGRAEKRTSLSHGWGVRYSYTGHDFHGIVMGPDGRLYFSIGDRGARIVDKATGKVLIDLPDEGGVFRCEPDGSGLELVMRGLRNPQELVFDDAGNLFTADNDSDQGDRERFVQVVEGGDAGWRVGWQHHPIGKAHNPWLALKMWEPRQKGTPPGIISPIANIPDGPSGVAYYPGTGLPQEYAGAFFVCGFKGSSAKSAVSTWKVRPNGAGFRMSEEPREFLGATQATDIEFGPDSRLYISDWGAEGWESQGRGRIYRVTHAAAHAEQETQVKEVRRLLAEGFTQRKTEDLMRLLGHADLRVRLGAQRALGARLSAAPPTEEALDVADRLAARIAGNINDERDRRAVLHAIWAMSQGTRFIAAARLKVQPEFTLDVPAEGAALMKDSSKDGELRAQWLKAFADTPAPFSQRAVDFYAERLADGAARARYFAALALSRKGNASATPAILAMLQKNPTRDPLLRHAGVMALAHCADEKTLLEAAKDDSQPVRLAAMLALARRGHAAVGTFLTDIDTEIANEAARLINDSPIAGAMPALAARLIDEKADGSPIPFENTNEQFLIRALNANFRIGGPENAARLWNYAAYGPADAMRAEALALLGQWAKPAPRDRVVGIFRPLPPRDATPAVAAMKPYAGTVFEQKSEAVLVALCQAVATLGAKENSTRLLALVKDTAKPVKARLAALDALAKLDATDLDAAIAAAGADANPALKTAASKLLGLRNPDTAAAQLIEAWMGADATEKQDIATALGGNRSAKAGEFLAAIVAKLAAEPVGTHLEILEAAAKHEAAKPALAARDAELAKDTGLAKWQPVLAGGDAAAGEILFKEHPVAACLRCHKIENTGGDAGPDLTGFATKHDRAYILESIVNVNAKIADGFQMVMLTKNDGSVTAGLLKKETDGELVLENPGTPAQTVQKADIKQRDNAPSGMLPNIADLLTRRELRDIIEYVASLK